MLQGYPCRRQPTWSPLCLHWHRTSSKTRPRVLIRSPRRRLIRRQQDKVYQKCLLNLLSLSLGARELEFVDSDVMYKPSHSGLSDISSLIQGALNAIFRSFRDLHCYLYICTSPKHDLVVYIYHTIDDADAEALGLSPK